MPPKRPVSKKIQNYVKKTIQRHQETNMRHLGNLTSGALGDGSGGAPGVNILLSDITGGDQQGQRQGNQITVTSARFKGFMTLGDSQNIVRLIFYIPKNASQVLSTSTRLTTPIDFDSITVLKDVLIHANDAGKYYATFNLFKRFNKGQRKGMTQIYSDGTFASVTKNPLYVYACSDSSVIPHPSLTYERLITYKDA